MTKRLTMALAAGALVAAMLPGAASAKPLRSVLDDPDNARFHALLAEGHTQASTLVGHQTVSNPSWTQSQSGVHNETTRVINNVFVPGSRDQWPTVHDALENLPRLDRGSSQSDKPHKRRR